MGFNEGQNTPPVDTEQVRIKRIVEVPDFKDVPTPRAAFYDVPTPRAKFEDEIIKRPIFENETIKVQNVTVEEVKKTVEVPDYKKKVYEIPEIEYVKKTYEIPVTKFVPSDILTVSKNDIAEINNTIEELKRFIKKLTGYVAGLEMPVIKEREVIADKLRLRDVPVDVIKPHYKCQQCGYEI